MVLAIVGYGVIIWQDERDRREMERRWEQIDRNFQPLPPRDENGL